MVFETLKEWNPWWEGKDFSDLVGVKRAKTEEIYKLTTLKHIKILAGIRRGGKSTILYQIVKELIDSKIDSQNILFINMEDEILREADFDKMIDSYFENISPKGDIYLFIDEIQNREKWEFWIKTKYDLRKFKQIFISGSSSTLLLSKYASLLTGRQLSFLIFPLSFKEFLKFKQLEFNEKFLSSKKSEIRSYLKEYTKYGGFPEIALEKEKHIILVEYYNSILEKDVIAKYGLEEKKVKDLTRFLISNISSTHSYKKMGHIVRLSPTTATNYIGCLENSFLIFQVPFFSYKVKEHMQYPRKIYCIDMGLVNSTSFNFSFNIGKVYENIVLVELKRRKKEIYYWKSKQQEEVDFIVKEGLAIKQLIQVCYNLSRKEVKEREIKALIKAMKEFKKKESLVITDDYENEELIEGKKIKYIPLWKWLLL